MSLFGSKKTKKEGEVAVVTSSTAHTTHAAVIIKPRVTEKAGMASEKNVYTFEVTKDATKGKVRTAIKAAYNVDAVKVNIINLPRRRIFVRGKFATQAGVKKALVFLKAGDKIEFV